MTFLGFDCKINGRAGAALQQKLGRVGLASTNTGRFRVGGSRCREFVADQSSANRFAQSFDQSLVSEKNYDMGTKQHVQNRILCKASDLNQ